MAEIYERASQVLVWLGPAYEDSDVVMKGLPKMQNSAQTVDGVSWGLALGGLCSRPYWQRLWVFQELKLARAKSIMCGSRLVAWQHFEAFMLGASQTPESARSERTGYVCNSGAMRMMQLVRLPLDTTLWDLLEDTSDLQCEEVRNKVYALLGLAPLGAVNIEPDCTTPLTVLLNKILDAHHEQDPPPELSDVASQCQRLESIFGIEAGAMFSSTESAKLLRRHGPIKRRIYTYAPKDTNITLQWATHFEHCHVRQLLLIDLVPSLGILSTLLAPPLIMCAAMFTMMYQRFLARSIVLAAALPAACFVMHVQYPSRTLQKELPIEATRHEAMLTFNCVLNFTSRIRSTPQRSAGAPSNLHA